MRAALIPILFTRRLTGGLALLGGAGTGFPAEPQGLGIDFTTVDGLASVAVKDTGTPGNNLSNAPADSFLTQSGTSPKLVLWSDGLYRWSPHNLILRSEDLTNASWTKSATTAPTATRIQEDGSTGGHSVAASDTLIAGPIYTYWVEASAAERTKIMLYGLSAISQGRGFDLTNGTTFAVDTISSAGLTYGVTDLGGGRYRCWISFVSAGTSGGATYLVSGTAFSYAGDNASGVTIYRSGMNRGTSPQTYHVTTSAAWFGVPIEYGATDGKFYALVEPAATNLLVQSQAFGTTWTTENSSVSSDTAVAPDGTTTADRLVENTANNVHDLYQAITLGSGTTAAFTVDAKADTQSYVFIDYNTDTSHFITAVFDLSLGATGETKTGGGGGTIVSTSIASLGNGWYRCTLIGSVNAANGFVQIGLASAATANSFTNGLPSYLGASKGIYLWQAQAEAGSVGTSPIPTFAATVTRSADNINVATSAFPASLSAGTWIVQFKKYAWNSGFTMGLTGNGSAFFGQRDNGTSTQAWYLRDASAAGLSNNGALTASLNTLTKTAGAYGTNDVATALNGAIDQTSSSFASWSSFVTNLTIGSNGAASQMVGSISKFIYVPRRMTNAELQARTAP